MSDEREPPEPPGDDAPGEPEVLHITELTPPPPPPPFDDPDEAPLDAGGPVVAPLGPGAPADTTGPADVDAPAPPDGPVAPPPPVVPTGPGPDPAALDRVGPDPAAPADRWPNSAKTAVVVLAVLAIAGLVAAIVGFSRASSAEDDRTASSREVSEALERAQDAETELAAAQADSAAQLEELTAERDAAVGRAEELESEAELLGTALAEQEAANEQLTADLAESEEARAELEALVGDVEALFPATIDPDLAALEIAGPYTITLTEISCVGLDSCGSPPQLGASSVSDEGGGLRLVVADQLDVPLVVVGGSLFGVADSQALVPPCGDIPRDPALTMGIFADRGTLDADGELAVTSLAASVLIDVQPVGDCPVGRVWYRAQLDRAG